MIGIIGGSGLYEALKCIKNKKLQKLSTPYGIVECVKGKINNHPMIFVSRHGKFRYPPHKVNHKANIFAMKKFGVKCIISTSAVGTLTNEAKPGTFALPGQLVDFTKYVTTFFEREAKHVDFTNPFCPKLKNVLADAALELGLKFYNSGTYFCFSGPQFETSAEIKMAELLGGDFIGMTVAPEAKLARELKICYQPIALVVNKCSGKVTHKQNLELIKKMEPELNRLIECAVLEIGMKKWVCSNCVGV